MAEDLYERYKNALRAGHVAVLRGHLPDALASYREAAVIAPDRALPHTSLGGVLLRLGHVDEALFEYEAALARAPHEEAVLLGRAEALAVARRPTEAASSLDGVADIQEASGRLPEAAGTLQRAIELASTPGRRARHASMIQRLQASPADADADVGLGRSLRDLEPDEPAATAEGFEAGEMPPASGVALAALVGEPAAANAESAQPGPTGDVAEDLDALARRAEAAIDGQDQADAARILIELTRAREEAGLLDAALDAAHLALSIRPDDPQVHLALVDLYLVRGWRELATEKLAMLDRLAAMSDDQATRDDVARVAEAKLGGDGRFAGSEG